MICGNDRFSEEEKCEILKRSQDLFQRGYLTGVNLITSYSEELPRESIIIHFLHDSMEHINYVRKRLNCPSLVLPRETIYSLDPSYTNKPIFDEEYKNSRFLDKDLKDISIQEAKTLRSGISVVNSEFDLLVPLTIQSLESVVLSLVEADAEGEFHFVDPFIIVKSQKIILTIPGFVNSMPYVNIRKKYEEFYAVLPDKKCEYAMKKYLQNLCAKIKVGNLDENSIAFDVSQINEKAANYIIRNIKPLLSPEQD